MSLQCDMTVHMVVPSELTRILQLTPRLKHLALELSGPAPPQTTVAVFRVISDLFGPQLESLGLSRFDITREAAKDFFSGMKKVRTFGLVRSTFNTAVSALLESDMAQNLTTFSSTNSNDSIPQEEIGSVLLIQMAEKLPKLKILRLINYSNISSAGFAGFAARCKGHLTSITLENCSSILATDLAAIVEANPFLSNVQFEKCRADDSVLLKLASPEARAARLVHLSVERSDHVTSNGIKSVVLSSSNLKTLRVSNCKGVTMSIFDEPWSSNHLKVLSFGTSSLQTQLSEDKKTVLQTGWDSTLKNMYMQLQKCPQMRELNLSRVGSDAKLFELGKSCIDSLKYLEHLTIACNMEQSRTIIWLGTRIPTLTTLVLEGRMEQDFKLLEDIRAINKGLTLDCKTDPLFTEECLQRERETWARVLSQRSPGIVWTHNTASDEGSESEREGTPFSVDDSIIHHSESDERDSTSIYEEDSDNGMSVLDDSDNGMSVLDDSENGMSVLDEDEDLDDIVDEEVDEDDDLDHEEESDYPMDIDDQEDSEAGGSLVDSDDEPADESDEPAYESDEPAYESDEPAYESDEPEPAYESDEPEPAYESDEPEPASESDEPEPASESDEPEPAYESDEPESTYESDEPACESDEPAYESDEPAYESDEPAYESEGPTSESDEPTYSSSEGGYES